MASAKEYGFRKDFDYKGTLFLMQVIPYIVANEEDRKTFPLSDGEFLVHLFSGRSFQSFPVFHNSDLQWNSNVSNLVLDDKELIEKIGNLIDGHYA